MLHWRSIRIGQTFTRMTKQFLCLNGVKYYQPTVTL